MFLIRSFIAYVPWRSLRFLFVENTLPMMYFSFVLIVFIEIFYEAGAINGHQGPPQSQETFMFKGVHFAFYSDRAARDEASSVCEAGKMHLAVLDSSEKAKWAAQSMGTSWVVFENMWIGAEKREHTWHWSHINKTLPEKPTMEGDYPFMYPPWVDFTAPSSDDKNCLVIDVNGNDDPVFVDLSCNQQRPFICEDDTTKRNNPWPVATTEYENHRYVIYQGQLPWSSSVSYCLEQGFSLATVTDMKITKKLGKMMMKSRPRIEDAWIGARRKGDDWIWIETGTAIKNTSDGFPPWLRPPSHQPKAKCVIIATTDDFKAHFVNIQCDRPRSFICSKKISTKFNSEDPLIYDRNDKRYFFYPFRATWYEANKFCESKGSDTKMVILNDAIETRFIVETMADLKAPLDHLWLGGKVVGGVWKWHPAEKPEENITIIGDEYGFPPWCDFEASEHLSCLNLDRQNKWTPLMYGLECNATQSFACVQCKQLFYSVSSDR